MNFAIKSYSHQHLKDLWNTLHPNLKFLISFSKVHISPILAILLSCRYQNQVGCTNKVSVKEASVFYSY